MFKSPTQTGPEAESYDRLSRYEGASPCVSFVVKSAIIVYMKLE